ncbi:unnamed protein product (macronuclear) [Paramecium tetraurelia]|uniref:IQ calmodulin-binding motif family protein n=1 Tax=Paramecium tetraurelia TaxID=5888 RepID=A0CZK4_PARTE|nr:uncharacterized protein GSPATT00011794001 [Paramecium tetraurelia]CAK76221.1 unnamed protein product [Paramecium tetraurelia]|eukprot:XP_001443618.1 hypothetical protein (macronuclear) [Paramecium tetraurelia strain d4-2]
MLRQNQKKLSLSLHQDYILRNYKDSHQCQTVTVRQQQIPKLNLSPIRPRQAKAPRQITCNLDVYMDQLSTANSQLNSKIKADINYTMCYDQDELKLSRKIDYNYTHGEKVRYRSTINPSTILRNNLQEKYQQSPENFLIQTSRFTKRKQVMPFKMQYQTEISRITNLFCQNQRKFKILNKFRCLTRTIGRFVLLYLRLAQHISDDYYAQRAKIEHFNSLKTAFKLDRNLNEDFIQKMQEWAAPAFQKILYYMEKNSENKANDELIDSEKIQDQEQLWCLNYAKFLFQNIELITRKGYIPIEIIKEVSKATMITKNTQMTLFLARRLKFQNSPLSKTEYQLMAGEFVYFNIIMRQFFDQANKLKYSSLKHNLQQKKKIIEVASIIHIYFIKYFLNMPQRGDVSDKLLFQRKLHISGDKNQELILIDTKDISLSETIIVGLKSEEHVRNLLKKKESLQKLLGKLFDKTIQNIYSQIEICDNLD